jgi:hypothetical protein
VASFFEELPIVLRRSHLLQQLLVQEIPAQDLHISSSRYAIPADKFAVSHM